MKVTGLRCRICSGYKFTKSISTRTLFLSRPTYSQHLIVQEDSLTHSSPDVNCVVLCTYSKYSIIKFNETQPIIPKLLANSKGCWKFKKIKRGAHGTVYLGWILLLMIKSSRFFKNFNYSLLFLSVADGFGLTCILSNLLKAIHPLKASKLTLKERGRSSARFLVLEVRRRVTKL